MLSVIFYGRNDTYGYNMHKRVAISLNCVAEVLDDKDDEILFVDYNTADDYPTLPEAICDLLTDKAKKRLRVFRVRPEIHNRLYVQRTHLKALEPVSRNVAVRRSNPKNRWILSSNTDMVFVPKSKKSLTAIVAELKSGYYCIPRFEMPETLWELLDRKNPVEIIEKFSEWGTKLHINDVVYGNDIIMYDAPGDFQLVERKDLFDIDGFHEDMLLGWHVDSNLAKRMLLYGKPVQSLFPQVYGYHCDHTKEVTAMHSSVSKANSTDDFIDEVDTPYIGKQRFSWGLAEENIEEIRIDNNIYPTVLEKILPINKSECVESVYNEGSYDIKNYNIEHIIPYITDHLYYQNRNVTVGYLGGNTKTITYLSKILKDLGFKSNFHIICPSLITTDLKSYGKTYSEKDLLKLYMLNEEIDIFIVDFATNEYNKEGNLKLSKLSKKVLSVTEFLLLFFINCSNVIRKNRSFIILNSIHSKYEEYLWRYFVFSKSPYSSRVRKGTLKSNLCLSLFFPQVGAHAYPTNSINLSDIAYLSAKEAFLFKMIYVKTCFDKIFGFYQNIPRRIHRKLRPYKKLHKIAKKLYRKLKLKYLFFLNK